MLVILKGNFISLNQISYSNFKGNVVAKLYVKVSKRIINQNLTSINTLRP